MKNTDIRSTFIQYFKNKKHTFVKSCPIAPENDPSLLFINAGMNQFKDVFLGNGTRPYSRATNSQICLRVSGKHNDLEDVGHDVSHLTLFEMLGNWSFGDYYKKEAITWAWDLLTNVYNIDKSKLYATVYTTDDESEKLWLSETDIAEDKVLRYGDKDNFWEMGKTGPCGPCSEVHIDRGPDHCHNPDPNHTCFVNGDCERYLEIWNLVFIQYNRETSGKLTDLPSRHVDTGAGFERLCAILQNVPSVYDTDAFWPIIKQIETLSGVSYKSDQTGTPHRVMADHIRPLVFGIADNVYPSNEGRGYVLRRLLRRALRYAHSIGINEPVLHKLVPTVISTMGGMFESIEQRQDTMTKIIKSEEISFLKTLDSGLELLQKHTHDLSAGQTLSGDVAFKLYDTYGFPIDLTQDYCKEKQINVDDIAFNALLDAQKNRSRQAQKFVDMETNGNQDTSSTESSEQSPQTNMADIVLDDTLHHAPDQLVAKGGEARILRNPKDKMDMARHHTGTHLLHEALRQVLGDHVAQAGSLVDTHKLRFDFSHFEAVSKQDLQTIENIVNENIKKQLNVIIEELPLNEAKQRGAMALFGEKYGDIVRTVKIGDSSFELCGGTHVKNTSDIEAFKIIGESAISSGTRRIEALAGNHVINDYIQQKTTKKQHALASKIDQFNKKFEATTDQAIKSDKHMLSIVSAIKNVTNQSLEALETLEKNILSAIKTLEKAAIKQQQQSMSENLAELESQVQSLSNGHHVLFHAYDNADMKTVKTLSDKLLSIKSPLILVLTCSNGSQVLVRCDKKASETAHAPALLESLTNITGGRGGGRPDMAQAGGVDASKIKPGLDALLQELEKV